jgi:RimJ/RimL family protein N-acetyltransferase
VTHPHWPVFDILISIPELPAVQLRPMTEADLDALSALLPDDVELDPAFPAYPGREGRLARGTTLHQAYWKSLGTWTPEAWRLSFAVTSAGQLVGVQELEGNDFARLRTLDSSSFLVESARGQGIGRAMRRAVLALGFGPLEARAAVTEAWHDNAASLGVSRSLGYQPNGQALHRRGDSVDTMTHLRLSREAWLSSRLGDGVEIGGYEQALAFFGA